MRRNRWRWALLTGFVLAIGLGGSAPAWAHHGASVEVDVGLFYKDLAPFGDWVEVPDYGWAWTPRVHRGWRPYANGRWVFTDDYGWLWLSDEDFGWAVFHYGRWYWDPAYEWVWFPGYEWGPGWVSWRSGSGYVGWAPLPPRVAWSARVGLRVGAAEIDALIEPRAYTFCEERIFVDPGVERHLFPVDRNLGLIRVTRNVTDYRVAQNRVVDRSLDVERLERAIGHRVPRPRVVDVDSVQAAHRGRVRGDTVAVFHPRVRARSDVAPPRGKAQLREAREADRHRQAEERGAQRRQVRERQQQERIRQDLDRRQARDRAQQAEESRRVQKRRQAEGREAERRRVRERQQQERAHQDLERRQARERQAMEKEHHREVRNPRGEADLDQRLAREHREMAARQQRERRQQEVAREQVRQEQKDAAAAPRRSAENRVDHRAKPPDQKREGREKPMDSGKPKDRPKDKQ